MQVNLVTILGARLTGYVTDLIVRCTHSQVHLMTQDVWCTRFAFLRNSDFNPASRAQALSIVKTLKVSIKTSRQLESP